MLWIGSSRAQPTIPVCHAPDKIIWLTYVFSLFSVNLEEPPLAPI